MEHKPKSPSMSYITDTLLFIYHHENSKKEDIYSSMSGSRQTKITTLGYILDKKYAEVTSTGAHNTQSIAITETGVQLLTIQGLVSHNGNASTVELKTVPDSEEQLFGNNNQLSSDLDYNGIYGAIKTSITCLKNPNPNIDFAIKFLEIALDEIEKKITP